MNTIDKPASAHPGKTPFHMEDGWECRLENKNRNCTHSEIDTLILKNIIGPVDLMIMRALATYKYLNAYNIQFYLNFLSPLHQYYKKENYTGNLKKLAKAGILLRYGLIDEGVPLLVGNIVLEITRQALALPEIFLGLETKADISEQTPAGESTGIDVPGQLWNRYHAEKETMAVDFDEDTELGMSHSADPAHGTFTYFAGGLVKAIPEQIQKGVVKQELLPGEYVVCRIEGESFQQLVSSALNQALRYLFEVWLPHHNLSTSRSQQKNTTGVLRIWHAWNCGLCPCLIPRNEPTSFLDKHIRHPYNRAHNKYGKGQRQCCLGSFVLTFALHNYIQHHIV